MINRNLAVNSVSRLGLCPKLTHKLFSFKLGLRVKPQTFKLVSLYISNKHISTSSYKCSDLLRWKHLLLEPESCLHDEVFELTARNLYPGSQLTLTSSIKDHQGHKFFTHTHYRADDNGEFDLKTAASLGGTYEGIFPMGPIAALVPGPNEYKYLRFMKKNISEPLQVQFRLLKGHLDIVMASEPSPSQVLDSVEHRRIYMAPGVQRIPVSVGRIRGALFLPEGEGPFPSVVDLFGTAGGLIEFRSAQFASRGIASLALAYFMYEDLPKSLEEFDISYFEEGVQFLLSQQKVKSSGVAALGVSKGADLACSMGTFIPEVKAVVCINGVPVNTRCPLKTKHKTYPGLFFDTTRGKIINPELVSCIEMLDDSEVFPETHIPLHEAEAKFFFIIAGDDRNWKTELETMRAVQRMKNHGKTNFEVVKYEGAGHLIEPCYAPFSYASYHKMSKMARVWGGSVMPHSAAQANSWFKIIDFIKSNV